MENLGFRAKRAKGSEFRARYLHGMLTFWFYKAL